MDAVTGARRIKYHEEDENTAYRLQVIGAREGAIKGTLVAGTIVALLHWRVPFVRKQTLAGKAFLASWGTVFGVRCSASGSYFLTLTALFSSL